MTFGLDKITNANLQTILEYTPEKRLITHRGYLVSTSRLNSFFVHIMRCQCYSYQRDRIIDSTVQRTAEAIEKLDFSMILEYASTIRTITDSVSLVTRSLQLFNWSYRIVNSYIVRVQDSVIDFKNRISFTDNNAIDEEKIYEIYKTIQNLCQKLANIEASYHIHFSSDNLHIELKKSIRLCVIKHFWDVLAHSIEDLKKSPTLSINERVLIKNKHHSTIVMIQQISRKLKLNEVECKKISIAFFYLLKVWYFNNLKVVTSSDKAFLLIFFKEMISAYTRFNLSAVDFSHYLRKRLSLDVEQLSSLIDFKDDTHIKFYNLVKHPYAVEAIRAFESLKITPSLIKEGNSGTYILFDRNKKPIAIFKPWEEEIGATCNPKGYTVTSATSLGYSSKREVAAFVLDNGFSKIPHTTSTKVLPCCFKHNAYSSNIFSSIQRYVHGCLNVSEIWNTFQKRAHIGHYWNDFYEDAKKWHKIAIQDIHFLNVDRHTKNVIFKSGKDGKKKFFPIDHGMCFPLNAKRINFAWMSLPDVKCQFNESELDYIKMIDINNERLILKKFTIEEEAIQLVSLSTLLLKKGAAKKLTAFDIGQILLTGPSVINPSTECVLGKAAGKNEVDSFFDSDICKRVFDDKISAEVVLDEVVEQRLKNLREVKV